MRRELLSRALHGNKRVAFAVVDVFLRINGFAIAASSTAIYADMMELFKQSTFDIEHLFPWLQGVVRPAQG
jgi:death-on-curing protein